MLQRYLLLFRLKTVERLKTAKHTSSLGAEREAAARTIARGLVAGRLPAQGRVSVRRPGLFVASHGPGHVAAPGGSDTIRSIACKSCCHDIGHRSPIAVDLEVDGAPFDCALFDGPGSSVAQIELTGQHAGFRFQSYDCIYRAHLAAHVKLPLAFR